MHEIQLQQNCSNERIRGAASVCVDQSLERSHATAENAILYSQHCRVRCANSSSTVIFVFFPITTIHAHISRDKATCALSYMTASHALPVRCTAAFFYFYA